MESLTVRPWMARYYVVRPIIRHPFATESVSMMRFRCLLAGAFEPGEQTGQYGRVVSPIGCVSGLVGAPRIAALAKNKVEIRTPGLDGSAANALNWSYQNRLQ
jgi:hypothetical protein